MGHRRPWRRQSRETAISGAAALTRSCGSMDRDRQWIVVTRNGADECDQASAAATKRSSVSSCEDSGLSGQPRIVRFRPELRQCPRACAREPRDARDRSARLRTSAGTCAQVVELLRGTMQERVHRARTDAHAGRAAIACQVGEDATSPAIGNSSGAARLTMYLYSRVRSARIG